jgi:hypothetical protein
MEALSSASKYNTIPEKKKRSLLTSKVAKNTIMKPLTYK